MLAQRSKDFSPNTVQAEGKYVKSKPLDDKGKAPWEMDDAEQILNEMDKTAVGWEGESLF